MAVLLNDKISPQTVRLGVAKEGDTVSFVVHNNYHLPFEGYEQGCGCLGSLVISPTQLTCDLTAKYDTGERMDNGVAIEIFTDGANYYRALPFGKEVRAFNISTYEYEDIPMEGMQPVTGSKFSKTIPIHFLDGMPNKHYEASGKYVDNPKKHKANVAVTFYIIKD